MGEPILNSKEKEELIEIIQNKILPLIEDSVFNSFTKNFTLYGKDLSCKLRMIACQKVIQFNNLNDYDCKLCWFNWFINEYKIINDDEGKNVASNINFNIKNDDIKLLFNNKNVNEIKKRDSYKCYTLLFKSINDKNKKQFINTFNAMIDYLKK